MAPAIEARSLSALTWLAANPPQYPRNPTHKVQESLVLYIAKVPGSKDVFLTTIKPQLRVVTAHDIESSLYYFHVDSEEDNEIREAITTDQEARRQSRPWDGHREDDKSIPLSFKRKPVPSSVQLEIGDRLELAPPRVYPHFQTPNLQGIGHSKVERKPLSSTAHGHISASDASRKAPLPKPIGPRPLPTQVPSTDTASATAKSKDRSWMKGASLRTDTERLPRFSVTIIRRDPASGGQWNVGRLTAGPTSRILPDEDSLQDANTVFLEITTEGYNRFSSPAGSLSNSAPVENTQLISDLTSDVDGEVPPRTTKHTSFCRQLLLENARFLSSPSSPRRNTFRSSIDSELATEWPASWNKANERDAQPLSIPPQHQPKPFTFLSPWNGTCEFTTKAAGRSLKCKHTIPAPANSFGKLSSSTYHVSELRFNLPSAKLFASSPKHPPLVAGYPKRNSIFSSSPAHSRSQSVDSGVGHSDLGDDHVSDESVEDVEDRMDLSLGREQAGGGMRGKQAKLGKLIVDDEGLKMLDLVVAANMAVWWNVYGGDLRR